jgi:hypothetical protein
VALFVKSAMQRKFIVMPIKINARLTREGQRGNTFSQTLTSLGFTRLATGDHVLYSAAPEIVGQALLLLLSNGAEKKVGEGIDVRIWPSTDAA